MRADYQGAEEVCLGILRRYPNNVTANGLLGDICAERGDLSQAAEWYELALDLTPDDQAVRQKMESVQERVREHEAAHTAKQLGLPSSGQKLWIYIVCVLLFLVGTGAVAYVIGRQAERKGVAQSGQVVAPVTIEPSAPQPAVDEKTAHRDPVPLPTAVSAATDDDRRMMQTVLAAMPADDPLRSRLIEARYDPRPDSGGPTLTLTFDLAADTDPKTAASAFALAAVTGLADVNTIILRGLRSGRLAYVASAVRAEEDGPTIQREWPAAAGRTAETGAGSPENRSPSGG